MTRFLLSTVAAAVLLASPVAIAQTTATPAAPAAAPAKPMAKPMKAHKMTAKKMVKGKPMPRRDAGSAAVDSLNDQALARAKAGQ